METSQCKDWSKFGSNGMVDTVIILQPSVQKSKLIQHNNTVISDLLQSWNQYVFKPKHCSNHFSDNQPTAYFLSFHINAATEKYTGYYWCDRQHTKWLHKYLWLAHRVLAPGNQTLAGTLPVEDRTANILRMICQIQTSLVLLWTLQSLWQQTWPRRDCVFQI